LAKLTILTCASGRVPLFANHVKSIGRLPGDCEYCIGFWGDSREHRAILAALDWPAAKCAQVAHDCKWPLPHAYNAALALATGERLLIVGSDVCLGAGVLDWAMALPDDATAWNILVRDSQTGKRFIAPERKVANPYAQCVPRGLVRGWDVAFANGVCYDDNDFACRLLINGVRFRWNFDMEAVHQTHPRYMREERRQLIAINRAVWLKKLNGYAGPLWPIFWDDNNPPDAPHGDGLPEQDALAAALEAVGYV